MASFQKNFVVKNGLEVGLNNGSILLATSDGVGIGSTAPTETLSVGGDVKISGMTTILSDVVIDGNLTVNGTEVIINTATLEVEDINIGIASAPSKLNNFQLDGAGITIYGSDSDKTLSWDNSNSRLAFNTDVYAPNLNIGGSTSFFDLDVDGHTELNTLNVSGISTFGGDLDVDGHTELDTINVSGITTTQNLEISNHTLLNTLNVSGISTFGEIVDIGGDLDVDGHTELDALRVLGISTLTNHLQIRSDDGNEGRVDFYCEVNNLHYTRLQAAPHSSYSGNATVVLPNSDGTILLTDGSGANLTDLNADNLLSGTIPDGRFPAVLPAIDGSALTNIVSGIGIGTSPGFVGFGITVLNLQGPGVSTATIDSATGIGTIFFEGGGGGGSISVSLTPPTNPDSGDLWYSPDHARTFIYYDENVVGYGTDAYWIDSAPFNIPPGNAIPGISTTGTTIFNNLNVSGITTTQNLEISNHTLLNTLNVSGISTFGEIVDIGGDLDVDGHTELNTLNVSGITTFSNLIVGVDMVLSGIGTAQEFDALSDINYKKNVKTVDNALDKIISLRGVSYDWKQGDRSSYGVIAQELEEILPELVHGGFGDDPKTVNYNGIIGVMIESIKELKQEVETLKKIINR